MYSDNFYLSTSTFLAEAEVGKHFYWNIAGFLVHGQVLIVLWFVFAILLTFAFFISLSTFFIGVLIFDKAKNLFIDHV